MSIKTKHIDTAWEKLGFTVDHSKKDVTAELVLDGKIAVRTKRSHGAGKLNGLIPSLIRQQMHLNERQFADALDCPLTREAYASIVRAKEGRQTRGGRAP